MVHALRRVARFLTREGLLIDLHPTADDAQLAVVDDDGREEVVGALVSESARERHAHADRAIATAVAERTLDCSASTTFVFSRYCESIDELADYVNANWTAHIDDALRAAARLKLQPTGRVRLWERVSISALHPLQNG